MLNMVLTYHLRKKNNCIYMRVLVNASLFMFMDSEFQADTLFATDDKVSLSCQVHLYIN